MLRDPRPWHIAHREDLEKARQWLVGLQESVDPALKEPDVGQLLKCAHELRNIGMAAVKHEAARMGDFADALRDLQRMAEVTPEDITAAAPRGTWICLGYLVGQEWPNTIGNGQHNATAMEVGDSCPVCGGLREDLQRIIPPATP